MPSAAFPPLLRLLPSATPAAPLACIAPAHPLHCCSSFPHSVAWPVPRPLFPPEPAPVDIQAADSPALRSSIIQPDRPALPAPQHPPLLPAPAPCLLACFPECSATSQSTPAQ